MSGAAAQVGFVFIILSAATQRSARSADPRMEQGGEENMAPVGAKTRVVISNLKR